jgi:hypothetical protein
MSVVRRTAADLTVKTEVTVHAVTAQREEIALVHSVLVVAIASGRGVSAVVIASGPAARVVAVVVGLYVDGEAPVGLCSAPLVIVSDLYAIHQKPEATIPAPTTPTTQTTRMRSAQRVRLALAALFAPPGRPQHAGRHVAMSSVVTLRARAGPRRSPLRQHTRRVTQRPTLTRTSLKNT